MIALSDEQREVQEWAREFAQREIRPRALLLDKHPESPEREVLLRAAARAGVLGSSLPDFLGGAVRDIADLNKQFADMTALGRVGMPDDIGPMVASLLGPDSRWINAQRIEVSGGQAI